MDDFIFYSCNSRRKSSSVPQLAYILRWFLGLFFYPGFEFKFRKSSVNLGRLIRMEQVTVNNIQYTVCLYINTHSHYIMVILCWHCGMDIERFFFS